MKKFRLERELNPWTLRYRCSALTNWAIKPTCIVWPHDEILILAGKSLKKLTVDWLFFSIDCSTLDRQSIIHKFVLWLEIQDAIADSPKVLFGCPSLSYYHLMVTKSPQQITATVWINITKKYGSTCLKKWNELQRYIYSSFHLLLQTWRSNQIASRWTFAGWRDTRWCRWVRVTSFCFFLEMCWLN